MDTDRQGRRRKGVEGHDPGDQYTAQNGPRLCCAQVNNSINIFTSLSQLQDRGIDGESHVTNSYDLGL